MSEQDQPVGYMQQLRAWAQASVVFPLLNLDQTEQDWEEVSERAIQSICDKVLESYRNGRAAGGAVRRETRYSSGPRRPAAQRSVPERVMAAYPR